MKFSGDPLDYADFIDRFKIYIHDKPHLNDDMRMIQLKMHVGGDEERAISGLGSKGIMYATALRTIKEQFGQPSVIARALVNNLTNAKERKSVEVTEEIARVFDRSYDLHGYHEANWIHSRYQCR